MRGGGTEGHQKSGEGSGDTRHQGPEPSAPGLLRFGEPDPAPRPPGLLRTPFGAVLLTPPGPPYSPPAARAAVPPLSRPGGPWLHVLLVTGAGHSTSPARRPAGWRAGSQPGDPEARAGERGPRSRPAPRRARPGSRARARAPPAQLRSVKGPPPESARARSCETSRAAGRLEEAASRLFPPKTPSCHP